MKCVGCGWVTETDCRLRDGKPICVNCETGATELYPNVAQACITAVAEAARKAVEEATGRKATVSGIIHDCIYIDVER